MRPLVSICCLTFNHEKFIADALDSFLSQECDFPYEIIVHDDASTDQTAKIIRQYERENSNIIRGIYQEENQYSQKISNMQTHIAPLVKGEFIATCEGDDYWCDTRKLKKQVEFLEQNRDYSMCFHAVSVVDVDKKPTGEILGIKSNFSRDITIAEAAQGGCVHVSSRLIRREYFLQKRPLWVSHANHGDYANALFYRAEGKVYYMNELMSCYRRGVEGSLMSEYRKHYSKEIDIAHKKNRIETLEKANEYYDYRYDSEIGKSILQTKTQILLMQRKFNHSARQVYRDYLKEYGFIRMGKTLMLSVFPRLAHLLAKIARRCSRVISSRNFGHLEMSETRSHARQLQ